MKVLPKLREKEAKINTKIEFIIANPQNYLEPQKNINELIYNLENVRVEIQKEETKINIVNTSQSEKGN